MKKILLLLTLIAPHFCYSMEEFDIGATTLPKHKIQLLDQRARSSELHCACKEGYYHRVEREIAKPNCPINKRARMNSNINASTPLYIACQHGQTNIVELLLTVPDIKVNKGDLIDSYGKPLHIAANPTIAKLLIEHGAEINATNGIASQTPLMRHILICRTAVARLLIKAGADVQHKDMDGHTALFYALQSDDSYSPKNDAINEIILELLKAGADPIQDVALIVRRYTFSSEKQHNIEQLQNRLPLLKLHSFRVYSLDNPQDENNPIFFLQNNAALLKYLYKQCNHSDPDSGTKKNNKRKLYQALHIIGPVLNCAPILRCASNFYCSDSSDISKRAACLYGRLFLYNATRKDLEELFGKKSITYAQSLIDVKKLFKYIKKGFSGRIENMLTSSLWGSKPIPHAQWNGKNMDDIRWCGKNMIEYAFKHKAPECLKALFSTYPHYNALCCNDVNEFYSRFNVQLLQPESDEECRLALQKSLCTELQFAIAKHNFDEAKRLVKLGIDVNAYNEGGYVPLHVAACSRHDDVRFVDLLITAGANVNLENIIPDAPWYQKTALGFAAKCCNGKIVHSLLKANADINCFNELDSVASLLYSPIGDQKISLVKELIENGVYIHQEWGELAEKGWPYTDIPYDCTAISTMLEKAYKDPAYPYKDPHCCVCLEYCVNDIPCGNEHPRTFICADCCSTIKADTNTCPICREKLIEDKKINEMSDDTSDEASADLEALVGLDDDESEDSDSEESLDGFDWF